MSEIFYYPDGTKIEDKAEFIRFYSRVYYYMNRDKKLEDKIENILYSDVMSDTDIIDILGWKLGAYKVDYEEQKVMNQWTTLQVGGLIEEIKGNKKISGTECETLKKLIECNGIGPVYAITILYFLTNGAQPIYDRYAHIALKVIDESLDFKTIIYDNCLRKEFNPDLKDMEQLYSNYKEYYVQRLQKIFGDDYKKSRSIDQALWTYGHLFNDTKTNQKKLDILKVK